MARLAVQIACTLFDSGSGKLLFKSPTGGALAGGLVTYARNGKQYVAFTSGNSSPASFGAVGRPTLVVMSLPRKLSGPVAGVRDGTDTTDRGRGREVYVQACAACHGPDGTGLPATI